MSKHMSRVLIRIVKGDYICFNGDYAYTLETVTESSDSAYIIAEPLGCSPITKDTIMNLAKYGVIPEWCVEELACGFGCQVYPKPHVEE